MSLTLILGFILALLKMKVVLTWLSQSLIIVVYMCIIIAVSDSSFLNVINKFLVESLRIRRTKIKPPVVVQSTGNVLGII